MRKFLSFLLSFPFVLHAQSDFLKDPDIVWAVELEQDWVVDLPNKDREWEAGVTTIKLLCAHTERTFSQPSTLSEWVSNSAATGELPIFRDPACTQSISWLEVLGYPRKIGVDSITKEETMATGCLDLNADAIKVWRLRQVLAFHRKNAR